MFIILEAGGSAVRPPAPPTCLPSIPSPEREAPGSDVVGAWLRLISDGLLLSSNPLAMRSLFYPGFP
jgi:hypothetical protein